jgi:hypothetical protein
MIKKRYEKKAGILTIMTILLVISSIWTINSEGSIIKDNETNLPSANIPEDIPTEIEATIISEINTPEKTSIIPLIDPSPEEDDSSGEAVYSLINATTSIEEPQNSKDSNAAQKDNFNSQKAESSAKEIEDKNLSKESYQEKGYIALETVLQNRTDVQAKTENSSEKIKLSCFNSGKIVFEGRLDNEISCDKIQVEEEIKNKMIREVTIKSEDHIKDPITLYASIPEISESQKNSVKILWKNQEEHIIETKEYYDRNNDGSYDQVSWIVPHLSEQIFEVIINFNSTQTSAPEIELFVSNPTNGATIKNPVTFGIEVNYTNISSIRCLLEIDGQSSLETIEFTVQDKELIWPVDLKDENHEWLLNCKDINEESKEKTINGSFIVNQSYSLNIPYKTYLLGTEEVETEISSRNNENATISLINPQGAILLNTDIQTPVKYNISKSIMNNPGIYQLNITFNSLAKSYSKIKNFSIAEAKLIFEDKTINISEPIEIGINITSPTEKILYATINFGDSSQTYSVNNNTFTKSLPHSYSQQGNYTLNITFMIGERLFVVQKNGVKVKGNVSINDTQSPTLEFINPQINATINSSKIDFAYRAKDNMGIDNCTFEIYNKSGIFWELYYSRFDENLGTEKTIEFSLNYFKEGKYSWIVSCYDHSKNYIYKDREFIVSPDAAQILLTSSGSPSQNITNLNYSADYEKKEEIEKASTNLESFLKQKEAYSLDQIEALDALGISENLRYYQKRLIQMKIDLSTNLKYMTDETLKEQRKKEILEEFSVIKESIPTNISILEKQEYVKNSITQNLRSILIEYIAFKKMEKGALEPMFKLNYDLQKRIRVTVNVKKIQLNYPDQTKTLALVTKKVDLKNNTGTILEVMPKNISINKIVFLTQNETIKENEIYEISPQGSEEEKIIYSIEGDFDIKKIEDSETILLKEGGQKVVVTSFFVYFGGIKPEFYPLVIVGILAVIFGTAYCRKKLRIKKWKKDENIAKIFKLRKQMRKALKDKEFEVAKEKYHQIQELYPPIPKGCKKYLYASLKKTGERLNKKDASTLAKEYSLAKKQGRKEDENIIYKKLKEIYPALPKKSRQKIYKKIFRPVDSSNDKKESKDLKI